MIFRLFISIFIWLLICKNCFANDCNIILIADDLSKDSYLKNISDDLTVELKSIFDGSNFNLKINYFDGENNIEKISNAVKKFESDVKFDIAITVGFSANKYVINNFSHSKKPIIIAGSDNIFDGSKNFSYNNVALINLDYNFSRDIEKFSKLTKGKHFAIVLDSNLKDNNLFKENAQCICKLHGISCEFVDKEIIELGINNSSLNFDGVFFMPFQRNKSLHELKVDILKINIPVFSSFYDESENVFVGASFLKDNPKAFLRRIAINVYDVIAENKELSELESKFLGLSSVKFNPDAMDMFGIDRGDAISLGIDIGLGVEIFNLKYGGDNFMNFAKLKDLILQNNFEIKNSYNVVDSIISKARLSKSNLLPQLSASFEGSKTSVSDELLLRDGYFLKLKAHQNLFDDKKVSLYRSDKERIHSAKAEKDIVRLNMIKNAYSAFTNVLRAKANLIALEQNLRLSNKALDDARNLVKVGSSRKSDIYRLESEISRVKSDLNLAYAFEKESFAALNSLINFPHDKKYAVEDIAEDKSILNLHVKIFEDKEKSMSADFISYCVGYAVKFLPDISKQNSEIAAQKIIYSAAKRERFIPKIGINAEFGKILFENESSAFVNAVGEDYVAATIDLSIPIFSGGRISGEIKKYASDLKIAENEKIILIRDTSERINNIVNLIRAHYGNFKFSEIAYNASDKNFHLIAKSYGKGEVGAVDLIDAKNTLISNKIFMLNQLYNLYEGYFDLQRILGLHDIDMLRGFLECFLKYCN